MSTWLGLFVVGVVGLGTYAMRAGMILALADRALPPLLLRALSQVPAAVLAAMSVTLAADPTAGGLTVDKAAAVVVAGIVARWRRNLIYTLIAGMATLYIVAAIV
ncbi:MAG: AzlD domain-containing protein [Acidimicrobiales bacterium]